MDEFNKTIETINKFHEITQQTEFSDEDKFFRNTYRLRIAESLLYDFGSENAKIIAKLILALVDIDKCGY